MGSVATTAPEARPSRIGRGRIVNLALIGVTAAVIFAIAFLVNQPSATAAGVTSVTVTGAATGEAPTVGKVAPDIVATTVDGKPFRLSDLRGHPVWLSFGASWCQPCRAENPDIQATWDKVKAGGVRVVQVFMSEDAGTVKDYATRVGLTYEKVPDPSTQIASEYRILGIPSHFFIDKDGVLRTIKVGSLDPSSMEGALKEIGG